MGLGTGGGGGGGDFGICRKGNTYKIDLNRQGISGL